MADIPDGLQLTPFDPEFLDDPYRVYLRLRSADPVHKDSTSFFENGSWTISSYDTVKALLTDKRLSVDPRQVGLRRDPRADNAVTLRDPDMMNLDGADHQRLRGLVQKAFTPSSVQAFGPRIEAIATKRLELISDPTFDVVSQIAKPLPTIVIAEYLGVDSSDHEKFKAWTDSLLKQGYPMPTEAQWDEIIDADRQLRNYVSGVIESRRESPQDDLVSRLIEAREQGQLLSDKEIVDMCFLLIGAGNFTTTDLISNTIFSALTHRPTEPSAEIVEETLRHDPPTLGIRRFVVEDLEVEGSRIPKGSVVNLLVGAANHDPAVFSDSDSFTCSRSRSSGSGRHLSFGRGPHHCLGASLARLEATITLDKFRAKFTNAEIASYKRSKRMDFRGFDRLLVNVF